MRVAIVAPYSRPFEKADAEGSGQNVFIRESAIALAKAGHNVDIIRRSSRSTDKKITKRGARITEVCVQAGAKKRLSRLETYRECTKIRLADHIDVASYDFFIAHFWVSESWVSQIRENSTKKVLFFSHAHRDQDYHSSTYRKFVNDIYLRLANKVIHCAYSKEEHQVNTRIFGKGASAYIRPGVSEIVSKKINASKKHTILFVGRMNNVKGFDLFCNLAREHPDFKFAAIGRNDYTDEIPNNITVHPFMSLHKLITHIAHAKLVISPSRLEYFGLVPLHAITSGTPVIASRTGGHEEVITNGKTGFLVKPNSYEALREAFRKFTSRPLQISNKEVVRIRKHFSWSNFVDDIVKVVMKKEEPFRGTIVRLNLIPKLQRNRIVMIEKVLLPSSVHIIPVNTDGRVIFLKEKKVHSSKFKLGLPAGIVEEGESPLRAAKRELQEEAGLRAKKWKMFKKIERDDTISDTRYYYVATDFSRTKLNHDETELIKSTETISPRQLSRLLKKGVLGSTDTFRTLSEFIKGV